MPFFRSFDTQLGILWAKTANHLSYISRKRQAFSNALKNEQKLLNIMLLI